MFTRKLLSLAAGMAIGTIAHAAGTASLTAGGYTQSFDSMGTSGTATPTGWAMYTGNAGTSNSTWTSSITANGSNSVASMVATTAALTATTTPTTTSNAGFNAAAGAGNTADRVIATSPTTVAGGAIQLTLVNNTGAAFTDLVVGYETIRYSGVSSVNELPGYWFFYSLDGGSWTNVASLNPTTATVPNSAGITSVVGKPVNLGAGVASGGTLYLRWVDDNAVQTSPDQIIGLNNVSILAVPEPAALLLAITGLAAIARTRRASRPA